MKTINPEDIKIIKGLPPVLTKDDRVAIDSEWFGMEKRKLHRPTGRFACAPFCFDGKTAYVVTDERDIPKALKNVDKAVWIMHNAKFDIFHLRRLATIPQRSRLWDTMLIEQIMFSGYYDNFSLADLSRRYLDVYLEKDTREEFNDTESTLTKEMIEYAAVDAVATWLDYQEQKKIIDDTDLNIWSEIELPFLWVILGMSGITLDKKAWLDLAEQNYAESQKIAKKYSSINLNSPMQVKKYFKDELGYNVESTGVDILQEKAEDGCQFAKDMLIYRTYAKRSSTYGKQFIEDFVEEDGKIYGDIYQMGACTSRTSARNPNLQNQPHENKYRSCFVSDKGHQIVVADYGAQEPRIAAHLSQDTGLIKALNGKEKLYIAIARDVLGKEIKKDSEEYKHMKSTVLGIFYGMSGMGLSKRLGIDVKQADKLIAAFLKVYPGVQEYIRNQTGSTSDNFGAKKFPKSGYVQSVNGRKIWLNKYDFGWPRNALNYPIQSTAAEMLKMASRKFLDEWCGKDFYSNTPLVLLIHDEIGLCVPTKQVKKAMAMLEKCMVDVAQATHPQIKGIAETFSGPTWGCKV